MPTPRLVVRLITNSVRDKDLSAGSTEKHVFVWFMMQSVDINNNCNRFVVKKLPLMTVFEKRAEVYVLEILRLSEKRRTFLTTITQR